MEWLKYNTAGQQLFTVLLALNSRSAQSNPTLAAGDVTVSKDGGAFTNIATLPDVLPAAGVQVRIQLSAAELTCKVLTIRFADQTAPAQWDEQYVQICTYGNASAFLGFDMSQTTPAVNTTQFAGQTVTAAAGVTLPSSVASPTNITAGTITTVTNLTNERSKYMLGAVWISSGGAAGTTSYTHGIMTNPVTGIADAKTLADTLLLKRFYTMAGTTITLLATMDGYIFDGVSWKVALGSRNISNSVFLNCISVTGVSSSSSATSFPYFINCEFGATATIPPSNLKECSFGGTVTLVGSGNYDFVDCQSIVAGTSTPIFDVNSVANVNISFRRWSGGITINNIAATTVISIDVVSGGTVTLNGVSGNVQVRGMCAGITDNRTGTPTLGRNAVINQSEVAASNWTNATRTLTSVSGLTSDANLVSINGQLTSGNNATLNLKKLSIVNNADSAVEIYGNYANNPAVSINNTSLGGYGMKVTAVNNGIGVYIDGSIGMEIDGQTSTALILSGTVQGLLARGATAGIEVIGGAGGNGTGIITTGTGTGHGLRVTGGATGKGVSIISSTIGLDIASVGNGINVVASGPVTTGIKATGTEVGIAGSGSGVLGIGIYGYGAAAGLQVVGVTNGMFAYSTGPGSSGIRAQGDDSGMLCYGNQGLILTGIVSNGLYASGTDNGAGLALQGGVTGSGIEATGVFGMDLTGNMTALSLTPDQVFNANTVQQVGDATVAALIATSANTMATDTVDDSVFTPTITEFEASTLSEADTDFWKGRTVIASTGANAKQARLITGYSLDGGKGHFTTRPFTSPLTGGSEFIIV